MIDRVAKTLLKTIVRPPSSQESQSTMTSPDIPLSTLENLPSPALLVLLDRLERNIDKMLEIARGPERLRPHAKTHKMPDLIRLLESKGISKHKCATMSEAEMIARAGGRDILIAYPIVGPNLARLGRLIREFPETTFRAVVDDEQVARELAKIAAESERRLPTLVDLDVGQGRTGIAPGNKAFELCLLIESLPGLIFDGLHGYDGHLREVDPVARRRTARAGMSGLFALRDRLVRSGRDVPRVVLGGTPTFPAHAQWDEPNVECSPGTCVFHDAGYTSRFPDLPFEAAALLLTRVISRPRTGRVCLDLGHKAVAADPIGPRLTLLEVAGATLGPQSEEHLIVDIASSDRYPPGTPLLAVPTHVCPTCALHQVAYVLDSAGAHVATWPVSARDRLG